MVFQKGRICQNPDLKTGRFQASKMDGITTRAIPAAEALGGVSLVASKLK
jgi:hypothetical protein